MTAKLREKINQLPHRPGVYLFKDRTETIVYVGKAKDLHKRVLSHFLRNAGQDRGLNGTIIDYRKITDIDFIPTRSEDNALILERELVHKYEPKYNLDLKDDKNFLFIALTDEEFPRIIFTHQPPKRGQTQIKTPIDADKISSRKSASSQRISAVLGPFVDGYETRELMRNLRRIFPYRTCKNKKDKPCLYYHLGLCNAHLEKAASYPLILAGLRAFLQLYAGKPMRVEGYDISNTQGSLSVGSMVSFRGGRPHKDMYRRFKIKTVDGSDDPASIKEVLSRRLHHPEWGYPDLVVIDGGKGQLSRLKSIPLPTVGLAKLGIKKLATRARSYTEGILYSPYGILGIKLSILPERLRNIFLSVRNEAHRFAITYHRKRQIKEL